MNLQDLFALFPDPPSHFFSQREVTGLFNRSQDVIPGSVYVAIKGEKLDGHDFLPMAVQQGATALVVSDSQKIPANFSGFTLKIQDTRKALDILASRFYGDPGKELFCVGVTGTNGKTSITYLVEAILNSGGHNTGVIGTVNHHLKDKIWPSSMTTPDPLFLQKRLREFRQYGATAVAIEVTSHALQQRRVDSVPFNIAIFTNLTRDHLDYHGSMEAYFQAKQRFFTELLESSTKESTTAIINTSDRYGRKILVPAQTQLITYGLNDADVTAKISRMDYTTVEFRLNSIWGVCDIKMPLTGAYNALNALAAATVGFSINLSTGQISKALNEFAGVPGRMQTVPNHHNRNVLIDYAHSPDALENVLKTLNQIKMQVKDPGQIILVFGCGGDRDQGKRPLMAQVAAKYADKVIITSDNPRTEDPLKIITDIRKGVPPSSNQKIQTEHDRKKAIEMALNQASAADVVLIAGKGHEDYQILGEEKIHFSDFEVARSLL